MGRISDELGKEVKIERVTMTHTDQPFKLVICVDSEETVETGGVPSNVEFIIGLLPLDVINDIKYSNKYNPRKLKPEQRDLLMEQIGTYGLINPLVAVLKKSESGRDTFGVYLIDGRHRYNALLELDEPLKKDILLLAEKEERDEKSISASHKIRAPRKYAQHVIVNYSPMREKDSDAEMSPMVPVKIYLDVQEVETIGMAVFLNRGQKKLSGGEQIEKVARAFDEAIELQKENIKNNESVNERIAAEKVNKSDPKGVVSSWIVANVMNESDSPWTEIIGRWQGETIDDKLKPLTANNFLLFVDTVVDTRPREKYDRKQRDLEVQSLIRLGSIFSEIYDWPDDIPGRGNRYTSTSVLARSFLIRALGIVLNYHFMRSDTVKLLSDPNLAEDVWSQITELIKKTHKEFVEQSVLRMEFEEVKKNLDSFDFGDTERPKYLEKLDKLRGDLWTLDTVTATLKTRLRNTLQQE